MKKTLIASAIAAATLSGTALAQTTMTASELAAQMDSMPTVYGNIQYALFHDNFDGGPSTVEHRDNGTTLGVLHDHELAPGITGFFKVELEGIGADDKSGSSGIDALDEAYIGVRGDSFGQLWIGSDDSTYETSVTEISEYYEMADLSQGVDYDTGEGDLIQYRSPSFAGLTLAAAVQVNGDGDAQVSKKSYPFQLAALYEVNALEFALAMDSNDGGRGGVNNENTYGGRASYDAGNFRLTGEYHTRKDVSDTYGVIGYYTLGANQFALSYELKEDDASGNEADTVTLQALHNLSDHMYVYFEGYLGGGDDTAWEYTDAGGNSATTDERSLASVGAVYYF